MCRNYWLCNDPVLFSDSSWNFQCNLDCGWKRGCRSLWVDQVVPIFIVSCKICREQIGRNNDLHRMYAYAVVVKITLFSFQASITAPGLLPRPSYACQATNLAWCKTISSNSQSRTVKLLSRDPALCALKETTLEGQCEAKVISRRGSPRAVQTAPYKTHASKLFCTQSLSLHLQCWLGHWDWWELSCHLGTDAWGNLDWSHFEVLL